MKVKIPILLIVNDRPYILPEVLSRIMKYTDWDNFELWILENYASKSVKKIIGAFKRKYPFINVYEQNFNQISVIQNEIISKLKREIYIKLDDDIFVTENWTKGFVNVINRHIDDVSIGSVVIPINGFSWKIFLEVMGLKAEFKRKFPNIEIIQGCTEPAVWSDSEVAKFIWEYSLPMEDVSKQFIEKVGAKIEDFVVPYRYSIGAISFTHDLWERMGGWKVDEKFAKKKKVYDFLLGLNNHIAKLRKKKEQRRTKNIVDIILGMDISALGIEEEYVFNFSNKENLKQYVTNESIVFHFSFFPTEGEIVNNYLFKITSIPKSI